MNGRKTVTGLGICREQHKRLGLNEKQSDLVDHGKIIYPRTLDTISQVTWMTIGDTWLFKT